MRIENVQLTDVFPNPKNPRKDFSDIEQLAETFENGLPFQPIQLLQQGGIYTIIDGERRYRAMKLLGTKTAPAVILENQNDLDVAIASVATNNKTALNENELSQGIQQIINLGEDFDETVERAARASAKTANEIRKFSETIKSIEKHEYEYVVSHLSEIKSSSAFYEFCEDSWEKEFGSRVTAILNKAGGAYSIEANLSEAEILLGFDYAFHSLAYQAEQILKGKTSHWNEDNFKGAISRLQTLGMLYDLSEEEQNLRKLLEEVEYE